jgi:hypothetical protein
MAALMRVLPSTSNTSPGSSVSATIFASALPPLGLLIGLER